MSKSCWNVLSQAAFDLEQIDKVYLFGNLPEVFNTTYELYEELTQSFFKKTHIHKININFMEFLGQKVLEENYIITSLVNFEELPTQYLKGTASREFIGELKKLSVSNDNYSNELIPFENNDVGQGLNMVHEITDSELTSVKKINGAGAILFSKYPHNEYSIEVRSIEYTKNLAQYITRILQIHKNEPICIEVDYLNAGYYEKFIKRLEEDIDIRNWNAGGSSLLYGNTYVLNGLRAIVAATNKMQHGILKHGLVIVLTKLNEGYVLQLEKQEEGI